jgi:hypothetical protein
MNPIDRAGIYDIEIERYHNDPHLCAVDLVVRLAHAADGMPGALLGLLVLEPQPLPR